MDPLKTVIYTLSPSWNSIKRNPLTSSKHNNTMFKGNLLINIYNEISKRNPEKIPKNNDFIQFPSWNSIKRKPVTSSKHNNTMFIGTLLTNIYNEISKRNTYFPCHSFLVQGTAPKEGLKGGFAARLYNVDEKNGEYSVLLEFYKRNPLTPFKHNNTMFKGILLINITNEITKKIHISPCHSFLVMPLISGSDTAMKEGLKGGFAARVYKV